jgi:hypothetical protein
MPNRTLIDFAGRTTVSCANLENQENHAIPLFEDDQFPSVSCQLGYQCLAIVFGSGSIFPRTRKRRQANTTYSTVISPSSSNGCHFRKNRHHRSSSKAPLLPQYPPSTGRSKATNGALACPRVKPYQNWQFLFVSPPSCALAKCFAALARNFSTTESHLCVARSQGIELPDPDRENSHRSA